MPSTKILTIQELSDLREARNAVVFNNNATPEQAILYKHYQGIDVLAHAIETAEQLEETVKRFDHALAAAFTEYTTEPDEVQAFVDLVHAYAAPVKPQTLEECQAAVERARALLIECLEQQKERQADLPPPADPVLLAAANRTLKEQLAEANATIERRNGVIKILERDVSEALVSFRVASETLGAAATAAKERRIERDEARQRALDAEDQERAWRARAEKAEADNAALVAFLESDAIDARCTCATESAGCPRCDAFLEMTDQPHPGAALLAEVETLRELEAAVNLGTYDVDPIYRVIEKLDALRGKAAADV